MQKLRVPAHAGADLLSVPRAAEAQAEHDHQQQPSVERHQGRLLTTDGVLQVVVGVGGQLSTVHKGDGRGTI